MSHDREVHRRKKIFSSFSVLGRCHPEYDGFFSLSFLHRNLLLALTYCYCFRLFHVYIDFLHIYHRPARDLFNKPSISFFWGSRSKVRPCYTPMVHREKALMTRWLYVLQPCFFLFLLFLHRPSV